MKNNNESNIVEQVQKIEKGFLSGYYTASMYELKELSKQKSFSAAEKEHFERIFMLPNDGAIDVHFSDDGKMNITTRTPLEQERYTTQISRVSYLIKNGYSNIDTTSEYLNSIIRYLKKEDIEITNLIKKGGLALITINNKNYDLMSTSTDEDSLSKIENEEVLFAEDKILTAKQLQESFDIGNKTLTLNTIKQLQKRESFTKSQQKDLSKIFRLPNKSAVETYFVENKLFYEERSAKEQELYDIQIDRLKSLMYGEIEKLTILSKYYNMANRFLEANNINIISANRTGVFYEFIVEPVIKVIENDVDIAKKRKKEESEKAKKQKIEDEKNEEKSKSVRTVEKRESSRLNIRQRMSSLNVDDSFLTDLPIEPKTDKDSVDNDLIKSTTSNKNETNSREQLTSNKANNSQSSSTMQTTMQTTKTEELAGENALEDAQSIISDNDNEFNKIEDAVNEENETINESANIDEANETINESASTDEEENTDEDKSEALELFNNVEFLDLDKNEPEDPNQNFETEPVASNNESDDNKSVQNVVASIKKETKHIKINLDDDAQFSKAKTDLFWKFMWLRVKENIKMDALETEGNSESYNLLLPIYEAFEKASDNNSLESKAANEQGGFYTYAQLSRLEIFDYLKSSVNDLNKKVASALLTPVMRYSKTSKFIETIEFFLRDPKVRYEMKHGLTNLDEVFSDEISDRTNNRLEEVYSEFVTNNKIDLQKILNEEAQN